MSDKRQSIDELRHPSQETESPTDRPQGAENLLLHPRYADRLKSNVRSNLAALAAARGEAIASAEAMAALVAHNPELLESEQANEILAALERAGSVLDAMGRAPLSTTDEDIEVLREASRVLYGVAARTQK